MLRYLVLSWDETAPRDCASAAELLGRCGTRHPLAKARVALEASGLVVVHDGLDHEASIHRFADGRGLVLGRLFKRGTEGQEHHDIAPLSFNAHETARLLANEGQELVREYWGQYIAVTRDWILRGPATPVPCLHIRERGVDLYFSSLEWAAPLIDTPLTIHWRYVIRTLLGPLRTCKTGLNEIREIPAGTCEALQAAKTQREGSKAQREGPRTQREGSRTQRAVWNPIEIASAQPIRDFEAAATSVHWGVSSCVSAWSSGHQRILHCLSGGLDSSLVLSALARARSSPEVLCLNHFSHSAEGDERSFARIAARHTRSRLIERPSDSSLDLSTMLHTVRMEAPSGLRVPKLDRIEPNLARDHGSTAIFNGHGGDEMFCRHHTPLYVIDAMKDHGVGRTSLTLALHSAVAEGCTIWETMGRAIVHSHVPRRWRLREALYEDAEHLPLVNRDLVNALRAKDSDELETPVSTSACPPGKLWQIGLLTARRPYFRPFDEPNDPSRISPLLSQPLIEICLRTPTYFFMQHHRDRAVARHAFRSELPRLLLHRENKGGSERFANDILLRNIPFVREMLLDGVLARCHVIDRAAVDAALTEHVTTGAQGTVPIFDLLSTEVWLRAWEHHGLRATA